MRLKQTYNTHSFYFRMTGNSCTTASIMLKEGKLDSKWQVLQILLQKFTPKKLLLRH